MVEVEVLGAQALGADAPPAAQVRRLCVLAAVSAGVDEGHLAIEFVDTVRIASLNAEHRGKSGPTDVLSFPIDGAAPGEQGARELGDVVICPGHTEDLCEAIVHGVLHLVGMDHETDEGQMLAVQAELLRWESLPASTGAPGA
ncbi:MAG: rRNA maturation RNase YbeY [Solirubrobacteraceae bacterium]